MTQWTWSWPPLSLRRRRAIICSKDTINSVQETLAQCNDEFKENVLLLSFGKVEGCTNISSQLAEVNEKLAPKPMRTKKTKLDDCLMVWSLGRWQYFEIISHEKVFLAIKREWTYGRNYETFIAHDVNLDVFFKY